MLPVYCDHFGLTREPFSITPDPSFLYLSDSHREALAQLVYGIRARRGFVVLTGEVGTGKTTLIRCLLDELNDTTKTAFIFNMIVSPQDLLRYVCEKFGLLANQRNPRDLHDYVNLLHDFLLETYRSGHNVALIIDEAQNLSAEVLENVRLLSNFETTKDKLIQILLVGQPELGTRLNDPELRQIKQRLALRHHLSPLVLPECKEYIAKRLEIAGADIFLFTTDAVQAIHNYSKGIPRLINILCDNGLLTAYALRKRSVEGDMVGEVARDLQLTMPELNTIVPNQAEVTIATDTGIRQPEGETDRRMDAVNLNRQAKFGPPQSSRKVRPIQEFRCSDVTGNPEKVVSQSREPKKEFQMTSETNSDIAPSQLLEFMIHALTETMGPMASWIVHEHVADMGESMAAFPKERFKQLVDLASSEILAETMKASFQQRMAKEIQRISNGKNMQ